jgi:hypothetical protein
MLFLISLSRVSEVSAHHHPLLLDARKAFHEAVKNPKNIHKFHEFSQILPQELPVYKAYKAVAEALLAQTCWDPVSKYRKVLTFDRLMNEAISEAPADLEIRFLRFCVEYHIPKFLGFSDHLEEDKQFIRMNIHQAEALNFDVGFIRYISYFMEETKAFDPTELEMIQSTLQKLQIGRH